MNVLLADDHALVRDALKDLIERQLPGTRVRGVASFDEAFSEVEKEGADAFDIVILDYRMPGMDGLSGLQRLKALLPEGRIAIMSGHANRREIQDAMAQGAAGFLPKTLPGPALSSALSLMANGERFVPSSTIDQGTSSEESDTGEGLTLTRRERDVLDGLLRGQSNKEIARTLTLQEVTIKLHVRSLCRKLEAKNRTHAVLRAMELGLA